MTDHISQGINTIHDIKSKDLKQRENFKQSLLNKNNLFTAIKKQTFIETCFSRKKLMEGEATECEMEFQQNFVATPEQKRAVASPLKWELFQSCMKGKMDTSECKDLEMDFFNSSNIRPTCNNQRICARKLGENSCIQLKDQQRELMRIPPNFKQE